MSNQIPTNGSLNNQVIFIGPQEIAGFLNRCATALADAGAEVIAFKALHTDFQPSQVSHPQVHWLFDGITKSVSVAPLPIRSAGQFLLKFLALGTAIIKADACLFIGGKGLFSLPIDYYILRAFGKRVVHMYVGTASRPRYLSAYAMKVLDPNKKTAFRFTQKLIKRIRRQRLRVLSISRAASCVIENPLCGHFQNKPFVNFFKLGIPITPETFIPDKHTEGLRRKLRILHCPSKPEIKGTARIQELLTDGLLKKLNAELIILTGVSHARVIKEIKQCDFVIDQLYSDSPLAGFAAESASHGKVPIVGGYGWNEIQRNITPDELPPAFLCHPDKLVESVEKICESIALRNAMSEELQTFLTDGVGSKKSFSKRMSLVINGKIPADWLLDPLAIQYKEGVGLSQENAHAIVSKIVALGGLDALQIDDKPELQASFQSWINDPSNQA